MIMFMDSAKDCFCSICYLGYHSVDPVRLVHCRRGRALWMVVCVDPFGTLCNPGFAPRDHPPLFFSKIPPLFSFQDYHQPTIINNSSSKKSRAAKTGRCLNIPPVIAPTSPIIQTLLLIMYGITMPLPMIGHNS